MLTSGLSLPELPPVLLALGAEGPHLLDLAPSDIPDEVASHAIGTVPPWNARREAEIRRLEDDADAALAWGERWLASIAQHPWMRPFDASRQGWVCGSDLRTPGPDLFRPPTTLSPRWLNCGLVPEHGSLGTTTTVVDGGLGPLPDDIRTPEGAPIWRLTMADSTRVRDVRTCEDWSSLVAA